VYRIVFLRKDEEVTLMHWPDKQTAVAQAIAHFPVQAEQKGVSAVRVVDDETQEIIFEHPERDAVAKT
jgi:hypothetical protein